MNTARAGLVAKTLAGLLTGEVGRAVGFRTVANQDGDAPDRQQQRARALRHALEDLGPLYVKIGQMLSTRPDMVPETMITELENLHGKVSPAPFSAFEPVLEAELGDDWKRFFRDVDTNVLGAASLAQVYRVTLASGKPAVVKIQRPGVRTAMLDDMSLLATVVRRVAKWAPDLNDVMDLEAMIEVIFDSMRPELDFGLEAENMDNFRDRVADFDRLDIPEVLFVTPRVLVQSLAPGVSIRDVNRDQLSEEVRTEIGTDLLALMFYGFFVDRQFHGDPHPGNVFISDEGRATIIDWGMVAKIDRNLSTSILVVLLSMGMNDGTSLARAWIEMGRATRRADIAGFVNDMNRFVPGIAGQSLERFNFGVQLTSILKYSSRRGISTSPTIAMLGKAFANVEGSIRYLAPEISITEVFEDEFKDIAQELVRELLSGDFAARAAAQSALLLLNGPAQARGLLTDLANRDVTFRMGEDLSKRSRHQDRTDARARRLQRNALAVAAAAMWMRKRQRAAGG